MSTPAQPLSNAPATTMPMISPGGQIGDIPVEHADNAAKAGFKHAVDMISPDGKHGTIPIDNAEAAQKAGFRLAGPTPQMQPSYSAMAAENSPSGADPHNPGNPNLNAVPESERGEVNSSAMTTQASTLAGQGAGALGAKALNSALSYLGFGAKVAETPGAKEVATGLVDQFGKPVMRLIQAAEPEVRPMLQKLLEHPAVQKGLQVAGKEILKGVGLGAGYEVLHKLVD